MEVAIQGTVDGAAIVHLNGRLDFVSAAVVRQHIVQTISEGHHRVVVDLGDVGFIDSSGLGALIGGLKAARNAGGDLRLARVGEQARVVLSLTTLDRVFTTYATVDDALQGQGESQ